MMEVGVPYELVKDRMSVLEHSQWEKEFELSRLVRNGRTVVIVQMQGPNLHFFPVGGYCFTKGDVLEVLEFAISKHGFIRTSTPISDYRQQRFNLRLGFKQVGVDNKNIHYLLDRI